MLAALPQILPGTLSQGQILLIILLVASLDALIVGSAVALGVLFIAFKAGKAVYDAVDKLVEWIIFTALRLAEDVLESPPLDKIPAFQLVLVGVKKAYDVVNGAQRLLEVAINILVTALAAVLMMLCLLALVLLNLAALGTVIYYLK